MELLKEAKIIISELLKEGSRLRPGQVDFVKSVDRYYRKYKRVSDKQLAILKEMKKSLADNSELNERHRNAA